MANWLVSDERRCILIDGNSIEQKIDFNENDLPIGFALCNGLKILLNFR